MMLVAMFSFTAVEPGVYSGVMPLQLLHVLEATPSVLDPVSTITWKVCEPPMVTPTEYTSAEQAERGTASTPGGVPVSACMAESCCVAASSAG